MLASVLHYCSGKPLQYLSGVDTPAFPLRSVVVGGARNPPVSSAALTPFKAANP